MLSFSDSRIFKYLKIHKFRINIITNGLNHINVPLHHRILWKMRDATDFVQMGHIITQPTDRPTDRPTYHLLLLLELFIRFFVN